MDARRPYDSSNSTRNRHSLVRDINAELQANLSPLERMAAFMYDHVGTPGFFLIIVIWTACWVLWNIFAPSHLRVDRGMEFAVWIFISNAIQLSLMPLLLIAQNLQTRHDRLRADNDFQLTKQSEQEIQVILGHLYLLNKRIEAIMDRLDLPIEHAHPADGKSPDVTEEQFAERQRQLLDMMALKLAQTHEIALQGIQQQEDHKPKRRLPK